MITAHFSPKIFSLGPPPNVTLLFSYSLTLLPALPQFLFDSAKEVAPPLVLSWLLVLYDL